MLFWAFAEVSMVFHLTISRSERDTGSNGRAKSRTIESLPEKNSAQDD
jgi:hypothetical protein